MGGMAYRFGPLVVGLVLTSGIAAARDYRRCLFSLKALRSTPSAGHKAWKLGKSGLQFFSSLLREIRSVTEVMRPLLMTRREFRFLFVAAAL